MLTIDMVYRWWNVDYWLGLLVGGEMLTIDMVYTVGGEMLTIGMGYRWWNVD